MSTEKSVFANKNEYQKNNPSSINQKYERIILNNRPIIEKLSQKCLQVLLHYNQDDLYLKKINQQKPLQVKIIDSDSINAMIKTDTNTIFFNYWLNSKVARMLPRKFCKCLNLYYGTRIRAFNCR